MSILPNNLKKISLFLERLPGIGEKTANRLAFYFLRLPEEDLKEFAENISDLKTKTKFCRICFNLTEKELCAICEDAKRDQDIVTVVESVLDLLSFETGNIYNGIYHVLHGKIDPLNHVGPDDIKIKELVDRVKKSHPSEIILATNPSMEGDATALYLQQQLAGSGVRITRLARGLPVGGDLEYADQNTLLRALAGRQDLS